MISLSRVLLVATLFQHINGAIEATETDAPRSSRITTLKPFNTRTRSQTVIRGLLGLRQGSCDPGYSRCDSVSCCPTGDSCCSLSDGCCPVGYYCDLDGCCPNGKFCTGSSNECVNAGDFLCPDGDGCCPNGDTCYRDSENIGRCRAGGGSPPPPTTKTTTTKTTATTTKPGTTTHSSQIETISIATGPTSAPTAPHRTNITWTGSWLTVTSSCSSGKQAKKISGTASSFATGTMSYSFQGTAVYVQVASTNAYYVVVIDEVDTSYGVSGGSTPTPANCTFGWKSENLAAGPHLLEITAYGASPESPDLDIPWSLEMQNLVVDQKVAKPSTSSGDGPGGGSSGASGGGAVGGDSPDSAESNHINFVAVVALTGFTFISLLL
ncbi:hypothetical protein B0H14DRAFT_2690767 [Mycena olivaceomarginata]|nr:hypothetical protein B0H14DRAFT_2690767 [Mycena olivaceomarginata]